MEVSFYNPLSTLLQFFANGNPLVIDGFNDLKISQQVQTLNIENVSSHTKRNQMIDSLSQTLPYLQGNTNAFKRIRFKAILSSYYSSYFEIERMPIHQWTPTQVAFSFFVYLIQKRVLSAYAWQFVNHMILLCEEEQLNGIVLYQLITKQNQNQNELMEFTHRICNKSNLNPYPLVQQMQNEIESWAQQTLKVLFPGPLFNRFPEWINTIWLRLYRNIRDINPSLLQYLYMLLLRVSLILVHALFCSFAR